MGDHGGVKERCKCLRQLPGCLGKSHALAKSFPSVREAQREAVLACSQLHTTDINILFIMPLALRMWGKTIMSEFMDVEKYFSQSASATALQLLPYVVLPGRRAIIATTIYRIDTLTTDFSCRKISLPCHLACTLINVLYCHRHLTLHYKGI